MLTQRTIGVLKVGNEEDIAKDPQVYSTWVIRYTRRPVPRYMRMLIYPI